MIEQTKVVILGGGTAGWMAATLMAQAWQNKNIKIQLIESPEVNIIGVGEGSTPQLKYLFEKLNVKEQDWMPQCNATYKHGIMFKGWSSDPSFVSYFHSFPAKTDTHVARAFVYNCFLRRQQQNINVNPSLYFLPAWLARQNRGPHANQNFPFETSYGYHFDSHQLGKTLSITALKLGVEYTQSHITDISQDEHGNITECISSDNQRHRADFFIDATGFYSFLLQKKLKVRFNSYQDALLNDSAVVLPTKRQAKPSSHTDATAMKYGWRWSIPLQHRVGNGYVYSSSFCSADQAEYELRKELDALDTDTGATHLKMQVGQVEQHWYKNCLAVGLSQGFLEPLEATALHLVQTTVEQFILSFKVNTYTPSDRTKFNEKIRSRFDGIRDYIVCHYKVNSRIDTDYWAANRNNSHLSDSLSAILDTWQTNQDLSLEIDRQQIAEYYSTLSWHTLLAGYGAFPPTTQNKSNQSIKRFPIRDAIDFNRRCALNFTEHSLQLDSLSA